ncbi:MAG TPA: hypothetical protein VM510_06670 [Caulifigura sp.]|nr:hypothetical protein [Caulifigura sp.]
MPAKPTSSDCQLSQDGPDSLRTKIDDLERWWRSCSGDNVVPWEELAGRLHDLRSEVAAAFQDCETRQRSRPRGDAGSREQLDQLIGAHALLLADLDKLVMRLRLCEPGDDCCREAEDSLPKLFDRFKSMLSQASALT